MAKRLKVVPAFTGSSVSIRRHAGSGMIRIQLSEATPQQLKFLFDAGHPSVEEAPPPKKKSEDE